MNAEGPDRLRLQSHPLYADVIVPRHLAGPFTYRVPNSLKAALRVGRLVIVPFGRSIIQGAVISLTETPPSTFTPGQLKEIKSLVNNGQTGEISPRLLQLARQVAEAYVAPWGQCLRLVMPPGSFAKVSPSLVFLTQAGRDALKAEGGTSSEAINLLKRLKKRPLGIKGRTLRRTKKPGQAALLSSLVKKGWIREVEDPPVPPTTTPRVPSTKPALGLYGTEACSAKGVESFPNNWEDRIVQAIEGREAKRLVVQAPSLLRLALLRCATQRTIAIGRKVLVLVGEAERAESLAAAISEQGLGKTVVLHGGLPDKLKAARWNEINQQRVQVVVGTRSAVFLPIHSLGLIWLDRDEDPAFKEPQEPRYHAREVAWLRAQDEQALLVMGSAHPTLETLAAVEPYDHLQEERVASGAMPMVQVVDLRGHDRGSILSPSLVEAIREALEGRAGILLFLNRKGYAGALFCRDCGQAPRCPSCQVAFAYYRHDASLKCGYCGTTISIPELCLSCSGPRLEVIGEGTERVEEQVTRLFPHASVLRVDGETMRRPKQAAAMWGRIQQREWDVLVGTQMILRDDVIPRLGLVGIVSADAGLSLPDFRAAERTYHLLSDAASLALPSSRGGRVIVQSYLPSHHAVQAIVRQDESIFKSEELAHRTALEYPPAVHLLVLHISGNQEKTVEEAARSWATRLSFPMLTSRISDRTVGRVTGPDRSKSLTILGPVPSPIPKIRSRYRRQILVKSHSREAAIQAIHTTVRDLEQVYPVRMVKFDVDVDPLDMW